MAIMEGLIGNVIYEIVKKTANVAWQSLDRNSKVLEILKDVGLKPEKPDPNFDSVYAHTLVAYGVDDPKEVLCFFHHEKIRAAFYLSFEQYDFSILRNEAETLVTWSKTHTNSIPHLKYGQLLKFNKKHIDIWLRNLYSPELYAYNLNLNGRKEVKNI